MRNAILAAAVLVPALAWADDQPYVLRNGRAVSAPAAAPAAPAASNQPIATANQPGAMGANAVRAAVVAAQAAGAPVPAAPSGQAFVGGGGGARRGIQRGTAVRRAAPARRATGDSTDAPPPYYDKPGALIRTAGQLPVYSDPGNGGTHSVEGGGFITIDQRKAHDSGRAPGVHWGPADTRPTVNPTSGAGGNAVTANGPAVTPNSGGSGGSGGGTHGNGGGDGNNGNGLGNGAGSGPGNNGGGNGSGGGTQNNAPTGTGFDGSF